MPGRKCTVCAHEDRAAIDREIVEGGSLRAIARRHGLDRNSINRHGQSHLPSSLVKVSAEKEAQRDRTLLERVEELEEKARSILERSEQEGRTHLSLAALRELRGIVELFGKVTGELRETPQVAVNLIASPDWIRVRAVVLTALEPFPEARAAVAFGLGQLEAGR